MYYSINKNKKKGGKKQYLLTGSKKTKKTTEIKDKGSQIKNINIFKTLKTQLSREQSSIKLRYKIKKLSPLMITTNHIDK